MIDHVLSRSDILNIPILGSNEVMSRSDIFRVFNYLGSNERPCVVVGRTSCFIPLFRF